MLPTVQLLSSFNKVQDPLPRELVMPITKMALSTPVRASKILPPGLPRGLSPVRFYISWGWQRHAPIITDTLSPKWLGKLLSFSKPISVIVENGMLLIPKHLFSAVKISSPAPVESEGRIRIHFHYHYCHDQLSNLANNLSEKLPRQQSFKIILSGSEAGNFCVAHHPSLGKNAKEKKKQDFPMQMKPFCHRWFPVAVPGYSSPHKTSPHKSSCWMNNSCWRILGLFEEVFCHSQVFLSTFKILLSLVCLNDICQLLPWVWSMSHLVWAERGWANRFWTHGLSFEHVINTELSKVLNI